MTETPRPDSGAGAADARRGRPRTSRASAGGTGPRHARVPGPIADRLVRQLELSLDRRVGGRMSGDHLGRGHGNGLELDRIRPYEPGDDVRKIDWNATARTLVPQVREDVPDRQLTAWLLLDHSPSMHFGTADRRKADVAEGAALVVGRFAARRGNRLGVVTFGAGRETVSPPAGGNRGMLGLLRAVATEPPEEGGGETSAARALGARRRHPDHARRRRHRLGLPRPARLDPGPHRGRRPARGHRPRGHRPSRGRARRRRRADPVDPETGQTLRVDTGDRQLRTAFDEAATADRASLAADFRRLAIRHLRLSTDGPWLPALAKGFSRTPDRTGRPA